MGEKLPRPVRRSVTTRYSVGYLLMLAVVLAIFTVSIFCSRFLNERYERMLDRLLEINQLFVDVEDASRYVYDYYTFLRSSSGAAYREERRIVEVDVERMQERLQSSYSRPIMDLCQMVRTYLDHSSVLVEKLDDYVDQNAVSVQDAELTADYNQTQDIISFISSSFQNVYTNQLVETEQTCAHIQRILAALLVLQVAAMIIATAIFVSYYHRVVHGITQPLQLLTAFAAQITQNPTEQREHVEVDTGDELELFANAFNEMVDTVRTQMERIRQDSEIREQLQQAEIENLRISTALQVSQLKLLQSRINPHFLFNTLNMIVQTAHMEDAEETAELMEITAEMMRYNLGKLTKAVTLSDELTNTQNYVHIQRCRFGARIEFRFEVDETCTDLEVPCLIIQPLVENAISHGLKSCTRGGQVTVRLYREEDMVCLDVADNGNGFPEQQLAELRASLDSAGEDSSHIGLANVYQRLRLFFGDALHFAIASVPGDTQIHIAMPGSRMTANEEK